MYINDIYDFSETRKDPTNQRCEAGAGSSHILLEPEMEPLFPLKNGSDSGLAKKEIFY